MTERSFSDLLRKPKDVIRVLADGGVLLRRRGAPPLWLNRADREEERSETLDILARTLRNVAAHNPGALEQAIADVFPWTQFLPHADRSTFAEEFGRLIVASSALDNFAPLARFLHEWRVTAEIYADPKLARRLRRPVRASGGSVPRPGR